MAHGTVRTRTTISITVLNSIRLCVMAKIQVAVEKGGRILGILIAAEVGNLFSGIMLISMGVRVEGVSVDFDTKTCIPWARRRLTATPRNGFPRACTL